jgi:hypothetical protein
MTTKASPSLEEEDEGKNFKPKTFNYYLVHFEFKVFGLKFTF